MEKETGFQELTTKVKSEIEKYSSPSETTSCCATGTCS